MLSLVLVFRATLLTFHCPARDCVDTEVVLRRLSTETPSRYSICHLPQQGGQKEGVLVAQGQGARAKAWTGWFAAVGLAVLIFLLYLGLTAQTTLWDRDEPRFAGAAVEMLESGQYLYPTFNHEPRLVKPILIYWLMALSTSILGQSELALRFWSPLGAALACLFTYSIGRHLWSRRVGIVAMVVLATTPLVAIEGVAATTDAVLLAAVTASMAALVRLPTSHGTRRLMLVAGMVLALATALLTKGPVALLVPILAVAGGAVLQSAWRSWSISRDLIVAAILATGLFALWAIPANIATGGRFLIVGIGREVFQRMVVPFEGHGGSFILTLPLYLVVIVVGFCPWTLVLPRAARLLISQCRNSIGSALILAWIAGPLALMSCVATKLPHYILPLWPALSLATAVVLVAGFELKWRQSGVWLFLSGAGGGAVALIWAAAVFPAARLPLFVMLLVLLTSVGAVWRWRSESMAVAAVLMSAMVAHVLVAGVWLAPLVEVFKPVPRVAAAVRYETGSDVPVAAFGFTEPSLVFYLQRPPVEMLGSAGTVRDWADEPGPGVLVATRKALAGTEPLPLEEFYADEGLNYAKGEWIELVALRRDNPL